jgi:hypothetical protein
MSMLLVRLAIARSHSCVRQDPSSRPTNWQFFGNARSRNWLPLIRPMMRPPGRPTQQQSQSVAKSAGGEYRRKSIAQLVVRNKETDQDKSVRSTSEPAKAPENHGITRHLAGSFDRVAERKCFLSVSP